MGVILAKFKKQKTTYQILEKLEDDIKETEALTISTREKQRKFLVNLYLISIGFLVLGCLIYYFYFLPSTWDKRIMYSAPIFATLIFIFFCLRRLGSWFFQKRLNKNLSRLSDLRAEKKKIIEKVMDTETYKVAIEILNRFGEKGSAKPPSVSGVLIAPTPVKSTGLHRRNVPQIVQSQTQIPQRDNVAKANVILTPVSPYKTTINPIRSFNTTPSAINYQVQQHQTVQQVKTPFPIINQNEKNFMDKILDFLMGDGQSNLYGMVCKECYGHNGMVPFEDYEYSAFRCAFCKVLNPAKKIRPIAPAIDNIDLTSTRIRNSSSSSSSSSSDREADSDGEVQQQQQQNSESETVANTNVTMHLNENLDDSNVVEVNDVNTNEEIHEGKESETVDERSN